MNYQIKINSKTGLYDVVFENSVYECIIISCETEDLALNVIIKLLQNI